jgi:hypothetical protein
MASTTGRRSVIPPEATPDRLRCEGELDSEGPGCTRLQARLRPFLAGARAFGLEPGQAGVSEDAVAGEQAGGAGRSGFVIGLDRVTQADALLCERRRCGRRDLAELF